MCCIFLILSFLGPRAGILIWWLADQALWNATFDRFIWPALGFLFVPWTTLMYVIVAPSGLEGFDWVWLGIAFVAISPCTPAASTSAKRSRATTST